MTKRSLVLPVLALLASPATAAGGSPWTVRFHGALVQSSAQPRATVTRGVVNRLDGASGGVGLGAEYRLSARVGLELSTLLAGMEVEIASAGPSFAGQRLELSMVPFTLGIPFHFAIDGKIDVYLGPTLSHVSYVNTHTSFTRWGAGTYVDVGSDTAPGAALGLDWKLGGGGWALSVGLRYLSATAGNTDVDPLIVTIGAAYRF